MLRAINRSCPRRCSWRRLTRLAVLTTFATTLVGVLSAHAASDGVFGLVSVGTTDVSIIRGDTAQASGLEDIILSPWSEGAPAPVGTATACIYSSTGAYQVTANSANGAGGRFRLTSGLSFINYRVRWNDGVTGLTPLLNGTPLAGRTGDSTSLTCNGADPATIQVRIPRIFIQAAPFGSYADTLTVIITPE